MDFLTKKTKINEGEVPQYYVEDSHPAIIEPWEWEQVQVELERRKNSRNRHHQTSPFSGKIICADCGDIFGAKTWHSTDRYRRVIWQCNGKFKGERKCETPHLTEERLKELYLAALGEYLSDREAAIDQVRYAQRMLTDKDFIDADIQTLEEELTTITGMLRLCIAKNADNTMTETGQRPDHGKISQGRSAAEKHPGGIRRCRHCGIRQRKKAADPGTGEVRFVRLSFRKGRIFAAVQGELSDQLQLGRGHAVRARRRLSIPKGRMKADAFFKEEKAAAAPAGGRL